MSLESAIPVRFSKDLKARLGRVSDATGVPLAQLVRIATEQYLGQIEAQRSVVIPCSLREDAKNPADKRRSDREKPD